MTAGTDWSRIEVEAAISDYFDMLAKELRGESFNKAEHNRGLQHLLVGRTKGSIERKHQNISAVLIELGYPYIDGYKPLKNVQSLLREVVEDRLSATPQLERLVETVVRTPVESAALPSDLLSICVPAPKAEADEHPFRFKESPHRVVRASPNYLEIEARNQSLGRAGEELVMQFEHQRLWVGGQRKLADRIEHVAVSRGDGIGYDIQSFETAGRERLIEVKTTRFGPLTPFFASRNEVNVSGDQRDAFHLYRLFKFSEQPRLFMLPGSLRQTCRLDPVQFSAVPA
jgi:Protein NO VEIN, C-terminal